MNHGNRGYTRELPSGQLEAAGAGQLDGQEAKEKGGELLSQTGPDSAAEGQVVKTPLFVLASLLTEAIGIEGFHVFEDCGSVVSVPNAVHHTPAFWDLDSLEANEQNEMLNNLLNGRLLNKKFVEIYWRNLVSKKKTSGKSKFSKTISKISKTVAKIGNSS